MSPTDAEIVRTLVRGRLPGVLRVAGAARECRPRHATVGAGLVLLLSRDGDSLAAALGSLPADHLPTTASAAGSPPVGVGVGPRAELIVDDVVPTPAAPHLGRARVSGRIRRLDTTQARAAALQFAQANPAAELLDVGAGVSVLALHVDRVRIERGGVTYYVDPARYAAAEPDPLHDAERDLLVDLADHHTSHIEHFFHQVLTGAGIRYRAAPRAVRLDRYGFTVDLGAPAGSPAGRRWARLEFARTVRDEHDLAHLLQPILFPGDHQCRHG